MRRIALILTLVSTLVACGDEPPPDKTGSGLWSVTSCASTIVRAGNYAVVFDHQRYEFDDGSVMVNCAISDRGAIYSNTAFYRKDQPGASSGYCVLVYDIDDTATRGFFEMFVEAGGQIGAATYTDVGSAYSGLRTTYPCQTSR